MPYKESPKKITGQSLHDLANKAASSPDAIFAERAVLDIAVSPALVDLRAQAIEQIARAHWNTTNVVVASLTSLIPLSHETVRRVSHELLAARFHPDRDIILSRAATVLLELSPPDVADIPPLAKALGSRIDLIHNDTERALRSLTPSRTVTLLSTVRAASKECDTSRLIKVLEDRLSNRGAFLPPRPADMATPRRSTSKENKPAISIPTPPLQSPPKAKTPVPQLSKPPPMVGVQQASPQKDPPSPKHDLSSPTKFPPVPPQAESPSLPELKTIANTSRDHAKVLSSIKDIFARHGRDAALECVAGFIWATSDPENPLKAEFAALSDVLFPD